MIENHRKFEFNLAKVFSLVSRGNQQKNGFSKTQKTLMTFDVLSSSCFAQYITFS